MDRLDAFELDAEAEPRDGRLGEVARIVGTGERSAVVGADGLRQAAFPEEALKPVVSLVEPRALHISTKREAWSEGKQ